MAQARTGSLNWYWAQLFNNHLYWITSAGLSTTPAPLLQSPSIPLTDVILLDVTLPPGATATNVFLMLDGATIVSSDWITVTVAGP